MPLLRNGTFVDDPWRHITDDALPGYGAKVIVGLDRLLGPEGEQLFQRGCCVGVRVEPHEKVEALEPWIRWLQVIALVLPKFTDGRAYSSAHILRDRLGYRNELRAVGDVLIDQYQFMRQCGFDTFEIQPGRALESWRRADVEMGLTYQNHPGPGLNILAARHKTRTAAAA